MTDEKETAVVDEAVDVLTPDEQAAEIMAAETPQEEAAMKEHVEIPWKKMVVGTTDAGLVRILHSELSMIEIASLGTRLHVWAEAQINQQAEAYNKAEAAGQV